MQTSTIPKAPNRLKRKPNPKKIEAFDKIPQELLVEIFHVAREEDPGNNCAIFLPSSIQSLEQIFTIPKLS